MLKSKICSKCKKEKPITDFGFSRPNVNRADCKSCHLVYYKEWRRKNPEKAQAQRERRKDYFIKYRADNKYERNEYNKKYLKNNPDKRRNHKYLARYGMTIDDYQKIFDEQNGVCAICDSPYSGRINSDVLLVDHDHKTGDIRGLLCSSCNFLLGSAKDKTKILENAIKYLMKYEKN